MTENRIDPAQERPAAPGAQTPVSERNASRSGPVRRVGSITLGIALVLTGGFFLAYYFWPGFDWQLAIKIAPPLMLVAMGAEVLFFACRPGRWKYDFLSVLSGLLLMGGCFLLAMLPAVWEQLDPSERYERELLCRRYEEQLYEALAETEQEVPLRNMEVYLDRLDGLEVQLELYGPYETETDFAQDCRQVLDAISPLQPKAVGFNWTDRSDPDRGWTGWDLNLSSPVQMDWTAGQMAEQTVGYGWRFEESEHSGERADPDMAPEEADSAETA